MSAITMFTDKVNIDSLVTANNTYNNADLSSYISSGSTGIMLEVYNTDLTGRTFYARGEGQTQTVPYFLSGQSSSDDNLYSFCQIPVKVDGSRVCEIKFDATGLHFNIIGEFGSGVTWLSEPVQKTSSNPGTWSDIDLSANISDDGNLVAAILSYSNADNKNLIKGWRANGSTDDIKCTFPNAAGTTGVFVKVDSGDIFEFYTDSTTGALDLMYLHAYITTGNGLTMHTNYNVVSPSDSGDVGIYFDLDITAQTSANATSAIFYAIGKSDGPGAINIAGPYVRCNGSTNTMDSKANNETLGNPIFLISKVDADEVVETLYVNDSGLNSMYVIGYQEPVADSGVVKSNGFFGM